MSQRAEEYRQIDRAVRSPFISMVVLSTLIVPQSGHLDVSEFIRVEASKPAQIEQTPSVPQRKESRQFEDWQAVIPEHDPMSESKPGSKEDKRKLNFLRSKVPVRGIIFHPRKR